MEIKYFNLSNSFLFLILALILFIKHSPNKRSNNFLGLLFILIAIYTQVISIHFNSVQTRNISILSHYLPLDAILLMLMSPTLYFYVLVFLNKPVKVFQGSSLIHLLALLPCLIINVMFYFRPVNERIDWLIHDFYSGSTEMIIINAVLYSQIIFYLIISYLAVRKQHKVSVYVEKDGFRTNITWVRLFLLINILVILISLPVCFFINNERTSIIIGQTAMNTDFIFLFIMTALNIGTIDTEKMEAKKQSYQINEVQAVNYQNIVTDYMETFKPYLDENCSLHSVSEQTKISESQISKLLNSHGGVTFVDFINEYRVKESLIYLQDKSKQRKTIDTIAIDCGFGSRSSFYRAFAKVYNSSPAAYRKQIDSTPEA